MVDTMFSLAPRSVMDGSSFAAIVHTTAHQLESRDFISIQRDTYGEHTDYALTERGARELLLLTTGGSQWL